LPGLPNSKTVMQMDDLLIKKIKAVFKGIKVSRGEKGRFIVAARMDNAPEVLSMLKDEGYIHLALISCVDWIDDEQFELVYILSSYEENDHIIVKTRIPRAKAVFTSIIKIFPNAEPYEREIHELFGVDFQGHPRQLPLFLERAYEIPPFRKDFDTRQYVEQVFDQVPTVEEDQ
jgi:NADH-quinone oxidoreductase subunit C